MAKESSSVLIEAPMFEDRGGWTLDTQFEDQMGSSYLIAHGMGEKVADAHASFDVPEPGEYKIWVRCKDWVPEHHPGKFEVLVNGQTLPTVMGQSGNDWSWELAGEVNLETGHADIALHDLTGFDGRADAIFITNSDAVPPETGLEVNRAWRKDMLGIAQEPQNAGEFDLVVVGDGVPAAAAAISAACEGLTVALVGDRPVIGGNASKDVGLGPRGYKTPLVEKMIEREEDGNLGCARMLDEEPNVHVFLNEHVFAADVEDGHIVSIVARNVLTREESRFYASSFIDASGRGALARLAGAEVRFGRESKEEFGESLAPDVADDMHHGNTLLFHLGMSDHPVVYGDVPWATEVSQGFSCLSGQMGALSQDNQPGPCAVEPPAEELPKLAQAAQAKLAEGIKKDHMFPPEEVLHIFPGTHFWEYGQFLDMDEPGNEEYVRDYLMRALYGTMASIKEAQPEKYANLCFEWLHLVPARGEYCRIMGDCILNENDVRDHTHFDDCVTYNDEAFCLHYPGDPDHDFRLGKWIWDVRDMQPYEIPFGSLYSKDIDNLMMAGKHMSASRVVSSSVKMMANGANHGIATGAAAALCKKYGETPRELRDNHMEELRELVSSISEGE